MFIRHATVPASIGLGRTARNVSFKATGEDWIAEVDAAIDGEEVLTEEQFLAIAAENETYNAAQPEPEPEPARPDAPAFKVAAYDYLGGEAFVMPLAGYIAPFIDSLNARNWALARTIMGAAAQGGAITAEQYADLDTMLAAHGIPEA